MRLQKFNVALTHPGSTSKSLNWFCLVPLSAVIALKMSWRSQYEIFFQSATTVPMIMRAGQSLEKQAKSGISFVEVDEGWRKIYQQDTKRSRYFVMVALSITKFLFQSKFQNFLREESGNEGDHLDVSLHFQGRVTTTMRMNKMYFFCNETDGQRVLNIRHHH